MGERDIEERNTCKRKNWQINNKMSDAWPLLSLLVQSSVVCYSQMHNTDWCVCRTHDAKAGRVENEFFFCTHTALHYVHIAILHIYILGAAWSREMRKHASIWMRIRTSWSEQIPAGRCLFPFPLLAVHSFFMRSLIFEWFVLFLHHDRLLQLGLLAVGW